MSGSCLLGGPSYILDRKRLDTSYIQKTSNVVANIISLVGKYTAHELHEHKTKRSTETNPIIEWWS